MKKIIVLCFSVLFFSAFPIMCNAEEITFEDMYSEQYESSGTEELKDALPDDVKEKLEFIDISDFSASWSKELSVNNIFKEIYFFLKSGCKKPIVSGLSVIALLIFSTAVGGIFDENKMIKITIAAGVTTVAVLPAVSTVLSCVSAIKSTGVFMLSFIPIYASVLLSRGKTLTAAGFSTVMLAASQTVVSISSFLLIPLTGMQLALSVSNSVSSDLNVSAFSKAIKKVSLWTMTLVSTVFLGVLGVQTAISSPADNLASKTAKFIVGSTVPIVGNTISEALSTIRGCIKILSASTVIYAVLAIALIVLPVIIELIIWRLTLIFCASIADVLSQTKAAEILRSVDMAFAFILGVVLLIVAMFVISITVVTVV